MRWLISSWPVLSLIWLGSAGLAAATTIGRGSGATKAIGGPARSVVIPAPSSVAPSAPWQRSRPSMPSPSQASTPLARRMAAWSMRWLISSWPVLSVMSSGSPGLGGGAGGRDLQTPPALAGGAPAPKRRAKTSNSSFACGGSGSPCQTIRYSLACEA